MEHYFNYVVQDLTLDDLQVLSYLYDNEIDAKYKSISNARLFEKLNITQALYRKNIQRLIASKMIEADTTCKNLKIYITEFGIKAVENLIQQKEVI